MSDSEPVGKRLESHIYAYNFIIESKVQCLLYHETTFLHQNVFSEMSKFPPTTVAFGTRSDAASVELGHLH